MQLKVTLPMSDDDFENYDDRGITITSFRQIVAAGAAAAPQEP